MANRAQWPQLGVQPQNLNEHATQLIAEAIALLALDGGQRPKLPDRLFESFINSVQTYARKTREQPSSHEILDKLNQIHNLTKSFPAEDITLIKNAVNHTITQSSARIPTWAEKVRSGGPPSHPPTPPISSPSSLLLRALCRLHQYSWGVWKFYCPWSQVSMMESGEIYESYDPMRF